MNIKNILTVGTFLFLWLSFKIPVKLELYYCSFFILSVGLIHGANDLQILKNVKSSKKNGYSKNLLLYVLAVVLIFVFSCAAPTVMLFLFIVGSSYHFGEQHLSALKDKHAVKKHLFFIVYGMLIISMLLYFNQLESIEIIGKISAAEINMDILYYFFIISLITFAVMFLFFLKEIKNPIKELLYLLIFMIVFKSSSLIVSFTLYFVLWHSIPSIVDQILFLSSKLNRATFITYLKSSFFFWLTSLVGLYFLMNIYYGQPEYFYQILLGAIASITFPHVFVMTNVFK